MPVDFADRVEFVSGAWIDAARESLERRVARVGSALEGIRFSICESFRDSPPHLGVPDGVAAWHARFDGASVTVGPGEIPDADTMIRAEYQTVLPIAKAVSAGDAECFARMQRENLHRVGARAMELAGKPPPEPVMRVLMGLHDDLARRTVGSPDLVHCLSSQGLDRHAEDLEERGYTVLKGAFSEAFADEMRAAILEKIAENEKPRPAAMLLERGRIFEEAALHPWLMALAEKLCGKGFLLAQLLGQAKGTGPGVLPIHCDYNMIREPFPEHSQACTAIWALEDFTVEMGPTLVVPESHRLKRHPRAGEARDRAVPILMPKGSIAIWDGATWHAQADRSLPGERVTLHSTYSRMILRTYDCYRDISHEILDRNPPELAMLAGLDDLFEKNTYAGPDFRRLKHSTAIFRS